MRPRQALALCALCAAAALLGARPASGAAPPTAENRVLILTTPDYELTEFMTNALDQKGIQHDTVRWDASKAPRPDLKSMLYAKNGTAKYSGIVMMPNLEALGDMKRAEVKELWRYQRRTGARAVKFNAWPPTLGYAADETACSSKDAALSLTAAAAPLAGAAGVGAGGALSASGLYRCPGYIDKELESCNLFAGNFAGSGIITKCRTDVILKVQIPKADRSLVQWCTPEEAAKVKRARAAKAAAAKPAAAAAAKAEPPVVAAGRMAAAGTGPASMVGRRLKALAQAKPAADIPPQPPSPGEGAVGVLVKYADGRQALGFTFDCGAWSPACQAIANISATWMAAPRPPPAPVDEEAFAAEAAADRAAPDEEAPDPELAEPNCVLREDAAAAADAAADAATVAPEAAVPEAPAAAVVPEGPAAPAAAAAAAKTTPAAPAVKAPPAAVAPTAAVKPVAAVEPAADEPAAAEPVVAAPAPKAAPAAMAPAPRAAVAAVAPAPKVAPATAAPVVVAPRPVPAVAAPVAAAKAAPASVTTRAAAAPQRLTLPEFLQRLVSGGMFG